MVAETCPRCKGEGARCRICHGSGKVVRIPAAPLVVFADELEPDLTLVNHELRDARPPRHITVCRARLLDGRPCPYAKMPGSHYCWTHAQTRPETKS